MAINDVLFIGKRRGGKKGKPSHIHLNISVLCRKNIKVTLVFSEDFQMMRDGSRYKGTGRGELHVRIGSLSENLLVVDSISLRQVRSLAKRLGFRRARAKSFDRSSFILRWRK